VNFGAIQNGRLTGVDEATVLCLIYQLAMQSVPSSVNSAITLSVEALTVAATKLNPHFGIWGVRLL
jgi:hypothetical protein